MGKTKTVMVSGTPEETKKKERDKKKAKITGVGLKGGERIKTVEVGPIVKEEKPLADETAIKKVKKPKVRGKKYKDARAKIDKTKLYSIKEAVQLIKETSYSSFDGTVELHLVTKKEGLSINIKLPHSAGKKKKVEVASDTTIKKLEKGKVDFDVLLATTEMMPKLVPFAKILGPKGLMPNPKNGTLIKSAKEAKKFSAKTITIKTEKKAPLVHTIVGKISQKEEEIIENTEVILSAIGKRQIQKAYLTSTMGPSVKIEVS